MSTETNNPTINNTELTIEAVCGQLSSALPGETIRARREVEFRPDGTQDNSYIIQTSGPGAGYEFIGATLEECAAEASAATTK